MDGDELDTYVFRQTQSWNLSWYDLDPDHLSLPTEHPSQGHNKDNLYIPYSRGQR